MTMNATRLSPNFRLREFVSKDTNTAKIDDNLVRRLQQLRDRINQPVYITSGYRSPTYNLMVGGANDSQHIHGKAADIQVRGMSPQILAQHAEAVGFDGIGVYSNHVHVDVRGTSARWTG